MHRTMSVNIKTFLKPDSRKKILDTFHEEDLYISFNPFTNMKKGTQNDIFTVNAFCLDIDYKNNKRYQNTIPEDMYEHLKSTFGNLIPEPNYVEMGNQIRLIYILKTGMKITNKSRLKQLTLMKRLMTCLNESLNLTDVCPDFQAINSYIRVPGSINGKNGARIHIKKCSSYQWELSDLVNFYMPELPKWYDTWKTTSKKQKKKAIQRYQNIQDLNESRLEDFCKFQKYQNKRRVKEGFRERLCFLYYVFCYKVEIGKKNPNAKETAKNKVFAFNKKFYWPLQEKKLWSSIRATKLEQYKGMRNSTILNYLGIKSEEAEKIGLKCATIQSGAERTRAYRERKKIAAKTIQAELKEKAQKAALSKIKSASKPFTIADAAMTYNRKAAFTFVKELHKNIWHLGKYAHSLHISIKKMLTAYKIATYTFGINPEWNNIAKHLMLHTRVQCADILELNSLSKMQYLSPKIYAADILKRKPQLKNIIVQPRFQLS